MNNDVNVPKGTISDQDGGYEGDTPEASSQKRGSKSARPEWRDAVVSKAGFSLAGLFLGVLLMFAGSVYSIAPMVDLGMALCITSTTYFVFQQIFDRANEESTKRIVEGAIGSFKENIDKVGEKIGGVDMGLNSILQHSDMLGGAIAASVVQMYAKREEGLKDIMADVRASEHVRMMGISLREYFGNAGRQYHEMNAVLKNIAETQTRDLKALLINPHSDQATIRAERESNAKFDLNNPYEDSGLYGDVGQSVKYLHKWGKEYRNIAGRVYNAAPTCFLVVTDQHTYVELYHYGEPRAGLIGGNFPLLKFPTVSPLAADLGSHFDYIWDEHSNDLSELVDAHMVGVSKNAWECKIMNVFPTRSDADDRIAYLLQSAKGEVRLIGISMRDFFFGGRRFHSILRQICRPAEGSSETGVAVKALLLDPLCEQGKLRSEREQPGQRPGNLFNEVHNSLNNIATLRKLQANVQVKLYQGAPSCFVVLTDQSLMVEQYHYGSSEPGANILGGKVPVLEFAVDSPTYTELSGHFDYLWSTDGPSMPGDEWLEANPGDVVYPEEVEADGQPDLQERRLTPK